MQPPLHWSTPIWQLPPKHVSPWVHNSPSSQGSPFVVREQSISSMRDRPPTQLPAEHVYSVHERLFFPV